jgi:hypothetical protein
MDEVKGALSIVEGEDFSTSHKSESEHRISPVKASIWRIER